jgi:hypothetical protein
MLGIGVRGGNLLGGWTDAFLDFQNTSIASSNPLNTSLSLTYLTLIRRNEREEKV